MVVGVPDANGSQGAAYVYTRGANGWQTSNEPDVLTASNGAAEDHFGYSVSVSHDGSVIAVGAPYASGGGDEDGQVYVFDRPGGGWTAQSTQTETTKVAASGNFDRLGWALALSPDGTYLAAGEPGYSSSMALTGQGAVTVWSYNGSVLSSVGSEPIVAGDPGNEDGLGESVAMPSDSLIYAGAPYHPGNAGPGAVYGFSSEGSVEVGYTPWEHVSSTELSASGSNLLGFSVAAGGGLVAGGAPGTASDAGAVYLFRPSFGCVTFVVTGCFRSSSPTTPVATLANAAGAGRLGESVALPSGAEAVLAGAIGYAPSPPAPEGAAYVFGEPSAGWADATSADATLTPPSRAAGDDFAFSVAISSDGGALAVGAPGPTSTTGEADVYEGQAGTAVGCLPSTDAVGEQTTCTATITDDGIGAATPTGTVTFATDSPGSFDSTSCTLSSTVVGLSSCQVSYTPTAAGSGSHTIAAQYSGDDEHFAPTLQETTVAIDRVTTTTTVSCSPAPVTVGDVADCTATITASDPSAGSPTGSVEFTTNALGTFSAGGCTLNGESGVTAGCAFTYTPSAIGQGTHQLTADYSGDGGHAASRGSDPLEVGEDSTRMSVTCAPLSVAPGKLASCSATVTDAGAGGLPPTGRVTGRSTGAGTFSTCTLARVGTDAARCSFSYRPANAGTRAPRLTLTYAGDDDHFASAAAVALKVPASGLPTVAIRALAVDGGLIRVRLACPPSETYCRVRVAIEVGSHTLAAGSAKIPGGSTRALALKPILSVLRGLPAGAHAAVIAIVAVDQSGRRRHITLAAVLTTGTHFGLMMRK